MQRKSKAVILWCVGCLNFLILATSVVVLIFLYHTRSVFNTWHSKNLDSSQSDSLVDADRYIRLYGNSFSDLVDMGISVFLILIGLSGCVLFCGVFGSLWHKERPLHETGV